MFPPDLYPLPVWDLIGWRWLNCCAPNVASCKPVASCNPFLGYMPMLTYAYLLPMRCFLNNFGALLQEANRLFGWQQMTAYSECILVLGSIWACMAETWLMLRDWEYPNRFQYSFRQINLLLVSWLNPTFSALKSWLCAAEILIFNPQTPKNIKKIIDR